MKKEQIEQREKALELELSNIQAGLEQSLSDLKDSVGSKVSDLSKPETWIKKYPVTMVVLAVGAGWITGRLVKKRSSALASAVIPQVPSPAPDTKKSTGSKGGAAFLKPVLSHLWQQFGPAVIAYGQQAASQKVQQMMESTQQQDGKSS